MTAMPAEKWTVPHTDAAEEEKPHYRREVDEQTLLDVLIETVAYYRELTQEYPTTSVYRRLLEVAERNLHEAEQSAHTRWSRPAAHHGPHGA